MTKKNEVTPVETNQIDLLGGLAGFDDLKGKARTMGFEDVDRSDIKLPRYKLLQLTSKDVADGLGAAGQFLNTITKEVSNQLECNLLIMGKTRVAWNLPFKRGEDPLCKSFDGKVKFDGTRQCDTCPMQDWNKLAPGQEKPQCNLSYMWLGVDKNNMPFRLQAGGASASKTKDFINTLLLKGYPPFIYKVVITSEKQSNEKGTFYVMNYKIDGLIDPSEAPKYQELLGSLTDMFKTANQIDSIDDDVAHAEVVGEENNAETAELF